MLTTLGKCEFSISEMLAIFTFNVYICTYGMSKYTYISRKFIQKTKLLVLNNKYIYSYKCRKGGTPKNYITKH